MLQRILNVRWAEGVNRNKWSTSQRSRVYRPAAQYNIINGQAMRYTRTPLLRISGVDCLLIYVLGSNKNYAVYEFVLHSSHPNMISLATFLIQPDRSCRTDDALRWPDCSTLTSQLLEA
jgi:hypothetical protein